MSVDDGPGLQARLVRDDLPPTFHRWRVTLPPGSARPTRAHSWTGVLVLVEQGSLEVECMAGGRQTFKRGDLLALGWLPLRTLHNPGPNAAVLVATRRARHVVIQAGAAPMKFHTTILSGGGNTTGIPVPADVMAILGAGKKPAVTVSLEGHTYRSTVATVDGRPMIALSAANREAAGVAAGDEADVEIGLDTAPRTVDVPADLAAALDAEPEARRTFDGISNSNKKWHVLQVIDAKTDETRRRRIGKSVAMLREGRAR